jgi:hypothetical protein
MKRSPLLAVLRIYDAGGDFVPVYYVDKILNELEFIGLWKPSRAAALADRFARTFGFDDFELQIIPLPQASAA